MTKRSDTVAERAAFAPRRVSRGNEVESVRRRVGRMAQSRGAGAKLPSVRELCETLGTSWVTLSAALEQLEAQSVLQRRPGSGIYVTSPLGRRHVAVVMASEFLTPATVFWGLLWSHYIAQCQERSLRLPEDYHFHLASQNSPGRRGLPEDLARRLRGGTVDGVIGIGIDFSEETLPAERGVPTVALYGCGDHLIDMAGIHRRLAAEAADAAGSGGRVAVLVRHDRMTDIRSAGSLLLRELEARGIPRDRLSVYGETVEDIPETLFEHGWALAGQAFGQGPTPDVLLFDNDEVAHGALAALQERGVILGGDVRVVSHANAGSPILYAYERRITRVVVDPARLAQMAVATMARVLDGDPPADWIIRVPPDVIRPAGG